MALKVEGSGCGVSGTSQWFRAQFIAGPFKLWRFKHAFNLFFMSFRLFKRGLTKLQSESRSLTVHGFYLEVVRLPKLFRRRNKMGNTVRAYSPVPPRLLHRWLALTKLPPCQPPGETVSPLCWKRRKFPSDIYWWKESFFSAATAQRLENVCRCLWCISSALFITPEKFTTVTPLSLPP